MAGLSIQEQRGLSRVQKSEACLGVKPTPAHNTACAVSLSMQHGHSMGVWLVAGFRWAQGQVVEAFPELACVVAGE